MVQLPSIQDIDRARRVFEDNEPRDLFYRAATELVSLAMDRQTSLSVAEALAVLLQTWNKMFYQYRRFDSQHFANIDRLVSTHHSTLIAFRQRSIEDFNREDESQVKLVFSDFEEVLGPVGAAKCLHHLAPDFFPLWDRAIARAYVLSLERKGRNADRYCRFMGVVKEQVQSLGGKQTLG